MLQVDPACRMLHIAYCPLHPTFTDPATNITFCLAQISQTSIFVRFDSSVNPLHQWICSDFKNMRVILAHYVIRLCCL
jgi:hypothetical protein